VVIEYRHVLHLFESGFLDKRGIALTPLERRCANLVNMEYRDRSGKALADYPRPSLAVDVALLTVVDGGLAVLVHKADEGYAAGKWSLPGTFVHSDELLSDAALRALRDKCGVVGESPRQLRAFDALDRDERGRVVSVAHVDLVPVVRLDGVQLVPISGSRVVLPGRQRRLPFDHDEIVAEAVNWARSAYAALPDPSRLLDAEFTLYQLRKLHEAVLGAELTPAKDTFRRLMEPHLKETGRIFTGTVGKPAMLYRRG
jgi:8-oxo-dGTP diphosphatase